jgi:CRP/FNR family cyclic AMP-dependent transcriptional regulator
MMAFLSTFDLLVLHEFTAGMPAGWLRRLAAGGCPVTFQPGDRLFREDAVAARVWLIHDGTVAFDLHVPGRGDAVVEHCGPGSFIGWEALVPPYRWGLGATALETVQAVELRATAVRSFAGEDPAFGLEISSLLLARVGRSLLSARYRLIELGLYPPERDAPLLDEADQQIDG